MYDLFVELAGVPEDVLAGSDKLQEVFGACSMFLVAFGFVIVANMIITIFRGWK